MGHSNAAGGNCTETDINDCGQYDVDCHQTIKNGICKGGNAEAKSGADISVGLSMSALPALQQLAQQYGVKAVLVI